MHTCTHAGNIYDVFSHQLCFHWLSTLDSFASSLFQEFARDISFTPTRYFLLSEMAHITSAKAKSPVHQQKFKSIKHEQVLVDNAVEDVVNRAWFECDFECVSEAGV